MKYVIFENVGGMLDRPSGHINYLITFVSSLIGIGMDVMVFVVDSSWYGDPQKRSRLFVKAVKMDLARMNFPTETHGGKDKNGNDLPKIRTCHCALNDLSQVDPVEGNGLVEIQNSNGRVLFILNHSKDGIGLESETEWLDRDKPAHIILRKGNVGHYEHDDRTLTV
mmetsp:Transcript_19164/g.28702  ORF Transcript_19164/g.28702 Transcript_19164/m.28702 type:complete len:167 (+) Transcript_19164:860-1360(+)|eukprot:CAMPEP_0203679136 /NCGR_PEP_ID=MMETSP0090-20130426/34519_1 /ASSEMBLY_ACC=CAM_ASM_001088 /TAXON_ID=426623 /ORGANISM="Chaetoceros affinis, Strain CCMP159" /LENGTH=166 /DNA_ID=CAMNT_0050546667 /DNA_START=775 /DNA_END=1275 /DNA_ORIENTATION=+